MGKYELPPLPYGYDALEPHIDARTMEIHHTKHHQTYTDKLNAALDKCPSDIQNKDIVEIFSNIDQVFGGLRSRSPFEDFNNNLEKLDKKFGLTRCMGRTRGQLAVPMTFGLRIKSWMQPMNRQQQRLKELSVRLLKVQLGGAVGDLSFFKTTITVNNDFTIQLLMFYAEELQRSEKKMSNLAHMQVKGRIAYSLLSLENKFGTTADGSIDIILSRQDLASYAGTTYETVFRILNEFVQDGLIAVSNKNIRLLNQPVLIKLTNDQEV